MKSSYALSPSLAPLRGPINPGKMSLESQQYVQEMVKKKGKGSPRKSVRKGVANSDNVDGWETLESVSSKTVAETEIGSIVCSMEVDTVSVELNGNEDKGQMKKIPFIQIFQRILNPKTTLEAALESPELLPLIYEKLKEEKDQINVIKVLSRLVWAFQSATRFAEDYLINSGSPLTNLETELSRMVITEPQKKKARQSASAVFIGSIESDEVESELQVFLSCLLVLMKKVSLESYSHWSIKEFLSLRSSGNVVVRWCTVQCLRLILGFTESETRKMISFWRIVDSDDRQFSLMFQKEVENLQFRIVIKTENVTEIVTDALAAAHGLSNIDGMLIKPKSGAAKPNEDPVAFPAFNSSLKDLLIHVANSSPVCVIGPIGSGKSTLIRYAASIYGRSSYPNLVSVQMSDQVDARLLLGSYHSTDLPGQFVWKPGCLTKAVLNGHWVVFEDMDSAPTDVITLLSAFIDSKSLSVPGYGEISHIHSDFRLFATCRTVDSHAFRSDDKIGKKWEKVIIRPFSSGDIKIILSDQHPHLRPIIDRLVEMYDAIKIFANDRKGNSGSNRPVSIRDFLKLCCRIPGGLDFSETSTALAIFQDALDLFAVSSVKYDLKEARADIIGKHLNLLKSKTEYYLTMYRPHSSICSKTNSLICGRFTLPIYYDFVQKREDRDVYSLTKRTCCLLETIAGCVKNHEPILLIGETGVGKTSCIQYMSKVLNQKLIVVNLNRQSDSADLLGGYKPVELKYIFLPLREEFEKLFADTFNRESNIKFLNHIMTCFANKRWKDLIKLMKHVEKSALTRSSTTLRYQWLELYRKVNRVEAQMLNESGEESPFAFSFIEGTLINAIKTGHWILLDEINLASTEMLQCLSSILDEKAQIHLWEKGDEEPIQRHPNFHLFAAMNPSTDVGKKDLPIGIRNRFTEFYLGELVDSEELRILVADYLRDLSLSGSQVDSIVQFYLKIRQMSQTTLVDGLGKKPHFSLRTLCRALKISSMNLFGSVSRSLFESFCLSFLTELDFPSHPIVEQLIAKHIFGKSDVKSIINQPLPCPKNQKAVQVEGYWIPIGDQKPTDSKKYVLTNSVRRNLRDISRIVSAGKLPVLIQGETSVGKTSLIQYLAELSGNRCYRINNHQHTDLQEYIGSYQSDAQGKLVFTEGVLVQAMRRGEWVILDELNLAPSEILESLNRLLDDNRQLFITETGITVTAHPRFMLFATQNPPGLYGGRKLLSRAFRNRFVELHFDEIPPIELEHILHLRCDIPASYCKKFITVMKELQMRRKSSAALQGKHGFATLRDLFRWAERYRLSGDQKTKFYDWDQHLADEGYLVLAGKERKEEEAQVIREVLEKTFKRKVDPDNLFSLHDKTSDVTRTILEAVLKSQLPGYTHIVWTYQMRRLAVLIGKAMLFKEPMLLVGETGVGKTTIVQLLSDLHQCQLFSISCHMNSEGSDFLGGLRPVRDHTLQTDRLFEWVNGPLVEAMEMGGIFLADEISLADDSVLERINSVLEPERTLLIAEKGEEVPRLVVANEKFHFVGTMNPGGDYGKKELSPALRNRLTEIWCDVNSNKLDLIAIVEHNLQARLKDQGIGTIMTNFVEWIQQTEHSQKCTISVRDYLSWVNFVNHITSEDTCELPISMSEAIVHGACLAFLDGLGTGNTSTDNTIGLIETRRKATQCLEDIIKKNSALVQLSTTKTYELRLNDSYLKIGPFSISRKNPLNEDQTAHKFALKAPTTLTNTIRLLRAMQVKKPILLEGSPGVGKTALVTAVAKIAGFSLTRINLSEQTDISDLFGADLPVEGKEGGHFEWRDGPLLQALKENSWILLDELNLASQSVLEGLNACLDHRGSVFIPELNKTFKIHDIENAGNFSRIFGCQNPVRQGGARKGLPKSFLNRFTQVYIESLTVEDFYFVLQASFPTLPPTIVELMSKFSSKIQEEICQKVSFGARGSPWDINLRDLLRWAQLTVAAAHSGNESCTTYNPEYFVDMIYGLRMRSSVDREKVLELFCTIYKNTLNSMIDASQLRSGRSEIQLLESNLICGHSSIKRVDRPGMTDSQLLVLQKDLPCLEALSTCMKIGWMPILVGPSGCGKTSLAKLVAQLCGEKLQIMHPSPEMDTIELLGGFEQADIFRRIDEVKIHLSYIIQAIVKQHILDNKALEDLQCLEFLDIMSSLKKSSHLNSLKGVGNSDELKWIETQLNFLQAAYIKCKSFLESESYTSEMPVYSTVNGTYKDSEKVICPERPEKEHLGRVHEELMQANAHLKRGIQTGAFQWIDSLLIKAVVDGKWLLIDGANRCSAAVLDRLNSLMESDGSLLLSERGCVDGKIIEIKPHPSFRLILAMDPAYGEISRAMRNRGVEIYMESSDTSYLNQVSEPTEEDSVINKNVIGMKLNCRKNDMDNELPNLREFGINYFDLNILLQAEGLQDRILRSEVLKLHRKIQEALSAFKDGDLQMFKVIASSKSFMQQLQQGIKFEEAMQRALRQTYCFSRIQDVEVLPLIESVVNGLQERVNTNSKNSKLSSDQSPIMLPGSLQNFLSSQLYRLWKYMEVFKSSMECQEILSTGNQSTGKFNGNSELLEDFVIVSIFSRIVRHDASTLALALGMKYPRKRSLLGKLADVLDSGVWETSVDWKHYCWDIQELPHIIAKFSSVNEEQKQIYGRHLLQSIKTSLNLYYQNQVFRGHLLSVRGAPKRATFGFIAKNSTVAETGNIFELLQSFWNLVTSFESLFERSLKSTHSTNSAPSLRVDEYAKMWLSGMKVPLWGKRLNDLCERKCDGKLPSEKILANVNLLVQWISEQVLPTLTSISGLGTAAPHEFSMLLENCFKSFGHTRNYKLLRQNQLLRCMNEFQSFLTPENASSVELLMSILFTIWCSNNDSSSSNVMLRYLMSKDGKTMHANLTTISVKLLRSECLTAGEIEVLTAIESKLAELKNLRSRSETDELSANRAEEETSKNLLATEEFLRLSSSFTTTASSSTFINPFHVACNVACAMTANFVRFLQWEEAERFRQTFINFPTGLVRNACLFPIFASRILLDSSKFEYKVPTLESNGVVENCQRKLLSLTTSEISQSYDISRNSGNLVENMLTEARKLVEVWKSIFVNEEEISSTCMSQLTEWEVRLLEVTNNSNGTQIHFNLVKVGTIFVEVASSLMEVSAYLPVVDPVVEKEVLADYLEEDTAYFETWIASKRLHQLALTGLDIMQEDLNSSIIHPCISHVVQDLVSIRKMHKDALTGIVPRPDPPAYNSLSQDIKQFVSTLGSFLKSKDLTNSVHEILNNPTSLASKEICGSILIQCQNWLDSHRNFVQKIWKNYWYWDVTASFLFTSVQASVGFNLIYDGICRLNSNVMNTKSTLLSMVRFPKSFEFSYVNPSGLYEDMWAYQRAKKRIFMASLISFGNKLSLQDSLTKESVLQFQKFCLEIAQWWKEQEDETQRKKEEEDAFYVLKGKERSMEKNDEEQEQFDLAQTFPSFEDDYHDLKPVHSLGDGEKIQKESDVEKLSEFGVLTSEDIEVFLKVYSRSMSYVASHWLRKNPNDPTVCDSITPLMNLFEIGCHGFMDKNNGKVFDREDEKEYMLGANVVAHQLSKGNVSEQWNPATYDFYHDSNISEAQKLQSLFSGLVSRVSELLEEWPDHPALQQIIKIVQRIESFKISSPIMKFLTGLELLLGTAQEWESVASKRVSISSHLAEITNLIICWRKLELRFWKNLSEQCLKREEAEGSKWWFYLFSATMELISDPTRVISNSVLQLFQQFMETSSIGQYSIRLNLLVNLHRHLHLMESYGLIILNQRIQCYLWNTICYYKQFESHVVSKLKDLKSPIEKKMKDFVKISRWNDANFYALTDSVKKSQKMLNKLLSEYKKVLKTSVSAVLIADVGVQSIKLEKFKLAKSRPSDYVVNTDDAEGPDETLITSISKKPERQKRFRRLPKILAKVKEVSMTSYSTVADISMDQVNELNELTGTIIEKVHELQNLPIPEKGNQRKKSLHNVHHLRRKHLADLFKTLQSMNLSHKRGIVRIENYESNVPYNFLIQPMDVSSGWSELLNSSAKFSGDKELATVWKGCDDYFQKCISRISVLLKAFQSPSKELGPVIIERCKGFVADLFSVVCDQKQFIGKISQYLWELRLIIDYESDECDFSSKMNSIGKELVEKAVALEYEVVQYRVLFESLIDMDEAVRNNSIQILTEIIKKIESCKSPLKTLSSSVFESLGITQPVIPSVIHDSLKSLRSCASLLQKVIVSLADNSLLRSKLICLMESLEQIIRSCSSQIEDMSTMTLSVNGPDDILSGKFRNATNAVLESILLTFQRIEKLDYNSNCCTIQESPAVDILKCFDLDSVVHDARKLRSLVSQTSNSSYDIQRKVLFQLKPIMQQYYLCAHCYLKSAVEYHRETTKLLSVLSSVFGTLAQKGFCLPEDYENEAMEEGPELDAKSGMGLGEGETTSDAKDVSDRIESEDQLDDTMKAGESADPADKDLNDDEKGVEMGDDFEGKQQEKEKKSEDDDKKNDSDSSGDEEEEMDKQMGDVEGEDKETLDDQMWGGSSDEEEDDMKDENDEKGKGVAQNSEPELAPKDSDLKDSEEKEPQENQDGDEKDEKNKKEFNEMDEGEINDDQNDPYHGQNQPEEEPEDLDLPDDLQLDDETAKDDGETPEENPFDLDTVEREDFPDLDENDESKEDADGQKEMSDQEDDQNETAPDVDIDMANEQEGEPEEAKPDKVDDPMELDEQVEGENAPEEEAVNKETEKKPTEDQVEPSAESETANAEAAAQLDKTKSKNDEVEMKNANEEEHKSENDQSTGQVESHEGSGQEGQADQKEKSTSTKMEDDDKATRKPGETDTERALSSNQDTKSRLQTLQSQENESKAEEEGSANDEDDNKDSNQNEADLYQHIKQAEKYDALTLDNATKEQAEKQQKTMESEEKESEELPKMDETEEKVETVESDTEEMEESTAEHNQPDLIKGLPQEKKSKKPRSALEVDEGKEDKVDVEGEKVPTYSVQRPAESVFHTMVNLLNEDASGEDIEMMETSSLPLTLIGKEDSTFMSQWLELEHKTLPLSQELCEQLRLILEPTQASRLKGDYKTGKRLNMRKVIPYIASGFRKDKIWLRRTQPSKREYQIVLALDDSASMSDNQSKQMAFSAVAVVAKALTLLEAGQLSVLSFGEEVKLLHPFEEPFTDVSGSRLLQQFTFAQRRTRIVQLMEQTCSIFNHAKRMQANSSAPVETAQLLIIISDGRAVCHEGSDKVKTAVRRAREQNIFIVFVIVDNPENKHSILDIQQPIFEAGNKVQFVKYMDNFPFPFYLILRDLSSLPSVLSDALRQWFELVTSSNR